MRIGEQHSNQFLIGIAYPTGDDEKDWNGSVVVDSSVGYYDWVFTDAKRDERLSG